MTMIGIEMKVIIANAPRHDNQFGNNDEDDDQK